jgi:hypothetical protein
MKPQLPELDVTDAKALLTEICLVVDSIVRIAGVGFPMWYRYRSSVQPFTGMPNDRASRQARSASRLATACGERSLCATRCLELCHDILQTFFTNIPRPIILDANVVTLRAEQIRPRGSIGRRPSALWQRVGGEALIASWDAARSAHKCRSRCVGYSERMEIVKLAVSRILATMQHPLSMTVRAAVLHNGVTVEVASNHEDDSDDDYESSSDAAASYRNRRNPSPSMLARLVLDQTALAVSGYRPAR